MNTETWQMRLTALEERCPWRPEPIISARYLIGRDQDVDNVIRLIQSRPVLVLHGETGVGKTSLFAGLDPSLQASFRVIKCAKWATAPLAVDSDGSERHAGYSFNRLLAAQVQEELALTKDTVESWLEFGFTDALKEVVYQVAGKMPILVLDQFEEFLRGATRHQEKAFVSWIEGVNGNDEPIKVILSLRSEYQHRLISILSNLTKAGKTDAYQLFPLDQKEDIETVILGLDGENRPVTASVAQRLTAAWDRSLESPSPLGLLPLKSMLYSLFWRANPDRGELMRNSPNSITDDTLDKLLEDYLSDTDDATDDDALLSEQVQRGVYYELVSDKLQNCEETTGGDPVMGALVPQILDQICAMRTFLATANFKEYRQLDSLFRDANQATLDFATGGLEPSAAERMIAEVFAQALADAATGDMLAVIRAGANQAGQWATDKFTGMPVYGLDFPPWDRRQDPEDKTSASWLGLTPRSALLHLARMFVMAAQWLDESHICRVPWDAEVPSITLFHDQLSNALRAWGNRHSLDSRRLAQAIVTSPFATLGRRLDLETLDSLPGCDGDGHAVVANARWTRNQIIGQFARVAFVNCDFRNTRFSNCRFEGVVFVNCSLDGTLFEGCTIVGSPNDRLVQGSDLTDGQSNFDRVWASLETTLSAPKFKIPVPPELADQIMTLRGYSLSEGRLWLYSTASGVAALPLSDEDIWRAAGAIAESLAELPDVRRTEISQDRLRDGAIGDIVLPTGGLAIVGGRVSSLMFSKCLFEFAENATPQTNQPVSALTLAYVGGSSVDFVEQDSMWLSIYGSALRGLSFSRPVDADTADASAEGDDTGRFQIDVSESALINTWIGSNIRGEIWANHSTLQALTSLSTTADGFVITASPGDNSNQQYVAPPAPENYQGDASAALMVRWTGNIEYKTNYRSRPAQAEYDGILAKDES
ncbi:MAG: pentapeptide repeat-containing protein [Propionibacteriaceae bacterium]|jgi:hypothetical protein|nr:pentapeptide repeat-containing protein [Propionibacteriaceae bacterium]